MVHPRISEYEYATVEAVLYVHFVGLHFMYISILILSFHLRLDLPNDLFTSGFTTKTLYTPHLSPIRATCLGISLFLI